MVCPYCQSNTAVINSRHQKRSNSTWRRRKCLGCNLLFTTQEMADLSSIFLVNTPKKLEAFSQTKLFLEILKALGDKTAEISHAEDLTATISAKIVKKASKGLITSQDVSYEAALALKRFSKQAYLRFVAEHPSLQK